MCHVFQDGGCTDAVFKAVITDNNESFLTVVGLAFACQVPLQIQIK